MNEYTPPLTDIRFVLNLVQHLSDRHADNGGEGFDEDLAEAVLTEAGRICSEVLAPLNRPGDEAGCVFNAGAVRTPPGFKEAYQVFSQGGWNILTAEEEFGGQGLPELIAYFVNEMLCGSNLSFSMYTGLSHGAYNAISQHAGRELKELILPGLVQGRFTGTMCLTEPHSGTDVGLIRTKAEPQPDGHYLVSGTKIFISAGEHDLAENIIHLVLATVPGAPSGVKGLSLFVVPKFLLDSKMGSPVANRVSCGAIEHKMGIKASSTCVMNFDGAQGYLVGTLHKGMRAMFTMMNMARLAVGVQGIGISAAAYQGAAAYAKDRLQGRALKEPRFPKQPADPLIVHPDVRRMLLTMRAYSEGMRAMGAWVAVRVDEAKGSRDPVARQEADDFVALMTPVCKALFTDLGSECANLGVQVFGGHGYIREYGMEQLVRDGRIAQIYEGTNGIQALDLVGRKLGGHNGRCLRQFFHPVSDELEKKQDDPKLREFAAPVAKAFSRLQQATGKIAQSGLKDPDEGAAVATDYLRLFGLVAMGYVWMRTAELAQDKQRSSDGEAARFYSAKLATARFFMHKLLPQTSALFAIIMAGGETIKDFEDSSF